MGHHALRIARGARGITERDGVPFVVRQPSGETLIALRQRVFVFDFADALAISESLIVDIDDERLWPRHQGQCLGDHAGELRINQDDLGAAMIELERDRGGIKPDVERVEHGAGHRYRKVQLVHRGNVRQHRRDGIAVTNVSGREIRREAPAARISLRPGEDAALVNDADMVGIDRRGARQETQRRQRNEIGGRLVQTDTVMVLWNAHRHCSIS